MARIWGGDVPISHAMPKIVALINAVSSALAIEGEKVMFQKLVVFVMLIGLMLSTGAHGLMAQEEEWTCGEEPNDILAAATAALDENDLDRAWWLSAHAEGLCHNDPESFHDAQLMRKRVERRWGLSISYEPGMVDLGGYRLLMSCKGEGSPTVIFETREASSFLSPAGWIDVLPAISTYTRACAYDRRGLGISDNIPAGDIRTTQDQVDDLAALLETASIAPPYILVGHSMGGLDTVLFVDEYPEQVQGIVLVDAMHADNIRRFREVVPGYSIPPIEQLDWATSMAQVAEVDGFGDRPLEVLTQGRPVISASEPEEVYQIWLELQDDYASRSTNSRHVIAENSGHDIMTTEPELIIDAVLWVLDEVRAAEQ